MVQSLPSGALMALLTVVTLALGGCQLLYPYPEPYAGYVYEIGSPAEIAEWALRQNEAGKIDDAMYVLVETAVSDPKRAEQAMAAYLRIHNKLLAGWPGLRPDGIVVSRDPSGEPIPPSHEQLIERLIELSYAGFEGAFEPERFNPVIRRTYQQMRPPKDQPKRLEKWLQYGTSGDRVDVTYRRR